MFSFFSKVSQPPYISIKTIMWKTGMRDLIQ